MDENKNQNPEQTPNPSQTPPPTGSGGAGGIPPVVPPPIVPEGNEDDPDKKKKEDSSKNPPRSQKSDSSDSGDITSEEEETRTGSHFLLKWFFILAAGLLSIFYFVLLWGLLSGNVSNPLFETLGIQPVELQQTLLLMTNSLFGFLSLLFLIGTLIKFFQWLIIGKDAENRRDYIVKSGVFLGVFLFFCAIWISLFWLITHATLEERQFSQSLIQTDPQNVIGLTSPVTVEFDLEQQLFENIDPSLIRQINWDFDGDGQIDASGPTVTHQFLDKGKANGRFPVTATVKYFSPSAQEEREFTTNREVIIANEAVVSLIQADPETGPVPLTVRFSAQKSRDPDGSIVLYEWDLDSDGEYEIRGIEESTLEKTFSKVGEFMVRLRVTGANNDTSVSEQVIVVSESEENLRAEIIGDEGLSGAAPFRVTLDGSQSFTRFGEIVRYEWFIEGEEKAVVGRKIQRTFRSPGEYKVSLTVENDLGEKAKTTETIVVTDGQTKVELSIRTTPSADQEGITRGTVPFEVAFDPSNSQIKNAVEWRWDFENDGIVDSYDRVARYIFRKPGVYPVKLVVLDAADKQYSTQHQVIVGRAGTQAKITAQPASGVVPMTVEFDGSASTTDKGEIVNYFWQFPGKDPISYGAQISYEFTSVGNFPVRLRVLTSEGEMDESTFMISVRAQPLQARFEVLYEEDDPLTVSFDPTSSSGTFTQYVWDFGDGETSREFKPTHTYRFPGEYTVQLKITDNKGVVSTTRETVLLEEEE